MYIRTNPGLGGYRRRRGLGLNCPGDQGCPGNLEVPNPSNTADLCAMYPAFCPGGFPVAQLPVIQGGPLVTSPQWIAGISNMVTGIAGAAFAALLFSKAVR